MQVELFLKFYFQDGVFQHFKHKVKDYYHVYYCTKKNSTFNTLKLFHGYM